MRCATLYYANGQKDTCDGGVHAVAVTARRLINERALSNTLTAFTLTQGVGLFAMDLELSFRLEFALMADAPQAAQEDAIKSLALALRDEYDQDSVLVIWSQPESNSNLV